MLAGTTFRRLRCCSPSGAQYDRRHHRWTSQGCSVRPSTAVGPGQWRFQVRLRMSTLSSFHSPSVSATCAHAQDTTSLMRVTLFGNQPKGQRISRFNRMDHSRFLPSRPEPIRFDWSPTWDPDWTSDSEPEHHRYQRRPDLRFPRGGHLPPHDRLALSAQRAQWVSDLQDTVAVQEPAESRAFIFRSIWQNQSAPIVGYE